MSTISASTTSTTAYKVTADTTGALVLQTGSSPTTAVTIDGSQNVGIGAVPTGFPSGGTLTFPADKAITSAGNGLTVGNNWYYNSGDKFAGTGYATQYYQYSGTHRWSVSSASGSAGGAVTFNEAMRIDTSGNLLVGKTSNGSGNIGVELIPSGQIGSTMSASTNATITNYVYSTGASAFRFYVGMAGTVYATSTTITGISDQRLKDNIRDLDDGLEKIMALQPRKFDWKDGKGKGISNDRGFIAQEFEQVFPDMIEEWQDPAPEGEEPYKAVNANLIPTLVKAIQEQQALITQLQADVAALKGAA